MKKISIFLILIFLTTVSIAYTPDSYLDVPLVLCDNYVDESYMDINLVLNENECSTSETSCTTFQTTGIIQCSDMCNITTNVEVTPNYLTFNGTGRVNVRANITGVNNVTIQDSCQTYLYSPNRISDN